jgi:hypothetical protein
MLFRRPVLERIAAAEITIAFRRWRRPTVRSGGRLCTSVGELAIEEVAEIEEDSVSEQDARRAGYADRNQLVRELSRRSEGTLYRIAFRLAGPDSRLALRAQHQLSPQELAAIADRLARLDRTVSWTRATLALIDSQPGLRAEDLAWRLGLEKAKFKGRVRRLKELGLTESLSVGYRLSPRGAAVLAAAADAAGPRVD